MAQQSAKRQMVLIMILILLLLGVAACTPPTVDPIPVRETPLAMPESTETDEGIQADCFQTATALAWLDENGDGLHDEGEPPLPGIEFVLEPTVYSRTTSDKNGIAAIFATTPGDVCPELLTIAVSRHDGYTLTTTHLMQFTDPDRIYAFGFQAETAVSTPNLLVTGTNGLTLSPDWPVTAVNTLFTWIGDGAAAYEFEQIGLADGRFIHPNGSDVTTWVQVLLASLTALEPVRRLSYVNAWTDDYPAWYVELVGADSRTVLIYSESTGFRGHAPWYVQVGDQFYRQTNGDIGYALYDLASNDVQRYFSLDQPAFEKSRLEPGGRDTIFQRGLNFTGLLPVAKSLAYEVDPASSRLHGDFVLRDYAEKDSSTHAITGVHQMMVTPPDSQAQICIMSPELQEYGNTIWHFDCPLPADGSATVVFATIQFTTTTDFILVDTGQIYLDTQ